MVEMKLSLRHVLGYKELDTITKNMAQFQPATITRILSAVMLRNTKQRFIMGVNPNGDYWKPSVRVIRAKGDAQILIDTGRLRDSIISAYDDYSARVGTNVHYAPIHQYGLKNIPMRSFLGFGDKDRHDLRAIIINKIKSMMGKP